MNYFTATSDGGTFYFYSAYNQSRIPSGGVFTSLEYSVDGGAWENLSIYRTFNAPIEVEGTLQLRGTGNTMIPFDFAFSSLDASAQTSAMGRHDIRLSGDIGSLLDYNANYNIEVGEKAFYSLFSCGYSKYTSIKDISNLRFPYGVNTRCYSMLFAGQQFLDSIDTSMFTHGYYSNTAPYCYEEMFRECAITSVPTLPAVVLADNCYAGMFKNCTSLANIPSGLLPAMTLTNNCYKEMFYGCTNIINTPNLPAKTLAYGCYRNMFTGCSSLTSAPTTLPALILPDYCYAGMFLNCSSLTTMPNMIAATEAGEQSCSGMFRNCTLLTQVSDINITKISTASFSSMFMNCTSLTEMPRLATVTEVKSDEHNLRYASSGYQQMFRDCTSLTTVNSFPFSYYVDYQNAGANYCFQQMFYGCENLETVLPTIKLDLDTFSGTDIFKDMFTNCSKLKFSTTKTDKYTKKFRLEKTNSSISYSMISGTGGTYTGDISVNNTYYIWGEESTYKAFIGVNNIPKEVTKIYVGVNGIPKEVTKIYVGVNGIPREVYSS